MSFLGPRGYDSERWTIKSRSGSRAICSTLRFIPHEPRKKTLIPYIYIASIKDRFLNLPRKFTNSDFPVNVIYLSSQIGVMSDQLRVSLYTVMAQNVM